MSNYILKNRTPVLTDDIIEWAKWFDNVENRKVALTMLDVLEAGKPRRESE